MSAVIEVKTAPKRMRPSGRKGRASKRRIERMYSLASGVPPNFSMRNSMRVWDWDKVWDVGLVFATSVGGDSFGQWNFTLAILPEVASFQALFDQYRVTKLELWATPQPSTVGLVGFSGFLSVVDLDDSTALASFNAGLQYGSVMAGTINDGHYRSFTPAIDLSAYAGGYGATANVQNTWVDCASSAVNHYGVKFAAHVTTVVFNVTAIARVHLQFRSSR